MARELLSDWLKSNVFNIITTMVIVIGAFWATNERVIRLEERVKSANDKSESIEKSINRIEKDIESLDDKNDVILDYIIELKGEH